MLQLATLAKIDATDGIWASKFNRAGMMSNTAVTSCRVSRTLHVFNQITLA